MAGASSWATASRSPWPALATTARETSLLAMCGEPDGALAEVASVLARNHARGGRGGEKSGGGREEKSGGPSPDPDEVVRLLRAHGEPHVRPRILSATTRGAIDDARVRDRLATLRQPHTRCGLSIARAGDASESLVAIAIDALADLEPLPTRARTGQWLTLAASIHVPATAAKVVVLGPRGLPRTVPTSIDPVTRKVQARFALDRPGAFTVQLVADLEGGPQPLLEVAIFADVAPQVADTPAPGEETAAGTRARTEPTAELERMVSTLRSSESIPPLTRDVRLDALAQAHAVQMRAAGVIAHDLGDGNLATRLEYAGLSAREVGENVARGPSLARAFRALHASPSHRMNLLRADYTHMGLSVLPGEDGAVYVCQVFATGLR